MMDFALSILALIAGGLTVELFTGARVSAGFQDEAGFRLAARRREKGEDAQSGNPS